MGVEEDQCKWKWISAAVAVGASLGREESGIYQEGTVGLNGAAEWLRGIVGVIRYG